MKFGEEGSLTLDNLKYLDLNVVFLTIRITLKSLMRKQVR